MPQAARVRIATRPDQADEQEQLDQADAQLQLNQLTDALIEEVAAGDLVRNCREQLKKAEAKLRTCKERVRELSFVARGRRRG
jgi:hypothetical protein